MLKASDIRQRFLDFFAANGHAVVDSSSLIPRDDPTLLFTNAGMVQFKKAFLGQEKRPYSRATTSQKCLRVGGKHNDLENVGRTARHHTFFEMLGNFSFGDYFKAEAIRLAWTFLTEEVRLPKEHLYVSVFREDDEAEGLWQTVAGVSKDRIYRLGEKDNFWAMGDTGPCGPCSEIYVDQGADMACGPDCGIGKCDCDRFLEVWNLVFMQYNRDEAGVLTPLPKPSIDTGMGLERISAVCQGVRSNFDSDLFQPIITFTAGLAGVAYNAGEDTDTALRVIADHSRSIAFLVADGVVPSNEGRGYVQRRLIRRAFRFGRILGLKQPFLFKTCGMVADDMGPTFGELTEAREFMVRVVRDEEERFGRTLDKGLAMLSEEIEGVRGRGETVISGDFAFKLYDTFGFPIDIINDVAGKEGLSVDEPAYNAAMTEQKTRAKKAWKGSGEKDAAGVFGPLLQEGVTTQFVGYDTLEAMSRVVAILAEDGAPLQHLAEGAAGYLVTAKTPFYGASGGQEGDRGLVLTPTGEAEVKDTIKPGPDLTAHKVVVRKGEISLDQEADLRVDAELRAAATRNHTCTHLLQAALRAVLGDHVKQSGSLVTSERLRFDFTHISPLSPAEVKGVEDAVNRAIVENRPVHRETLPYKEAVARGALALFGEKYGDQVCLVEVPTVSLELCGGTHLTATGQAGSFYIVSEGGVAAGVRRIEAVTGLNAVKSVQARRDELDEAAGLLRVPPSELSAKIKGLQAQLKAKDKEIESLQGRLISGKGKDLMDEVADIGGTKVLAVKVETGNVKALRDQMDDLRSKLASGVILLAGVADGKAMLILSVSKDLHGRFTAPGLIKDIAPLVGGSGGGRPDMAQAGGPDVDGVDKAMAKLRELVGA